MDVASDGVDTADNTAANTSSSASDTATGVHDAPSEALRGAEHLSESALAGRGLVLRRSIGIESLRGVSSYAQQAVQIAHSKASSTHMNSSTLLSILRDDLGDGLLLGAVEARHLARCGRALGGIAIRVVSHDLGVAGAAFLGKQGARRLLD